MLPFFAHMPSSQPLPHSSLAVALARRRAQDGRCAAPSPRGACGMHHDPPLLCRLPHEARSNPPHPRNVLLHFVRV